MELKHYLFIGWIAFWIIGHKVIKSKYTIIEGKSGTKTDKRFKKGYRDTTEYNYKIPYKKLILFALLNICIYGIIVFFNRL